MELIEILKSKNEELYHDFLRIKKNVEPILSQIAINFPQFTSHDINHSETVIIRLNTIVPDSLKNELNEYEIFFLLCSACLHDIGMADLDKITDNWGASAEIIRDHHNERSCVFIRDYFDEIGISDRFQGNIIGKICLGHRKEDLHNKELFPQEKAYKHFNINIALLSSLLRIGDELDITFERTPDAIFDNFNFENEFSKGEWEKHLSISGVTSTSNPLFIRCDATCESPNIHRALKKLEVKINSQLEDLPYHMHNYNDLIRDLPRKFMVEIEPIGYKSYDFKFSLDDNAIYTLLKGEKIYGSKNESIRELLKNSVDACRFKQKTIKEDYNPKISFELTNENEKLIIRDNGIGMDEYIIEMYLTKIGRSFYRSEDFLDKNLDFDPVNELGIGFLSCFMIADRIIIETKTDSSDSLKLEFDNVSDYFIVKTGEMDSSGTKITLFLKEDFKKNLNLHSILRYYARHLEFEITLITPNHPEIEIRSIDKIPFSLEKDFVYDESYKIYIEEEDFELWIYFFLKRYDEILFFEPFKYRAANQFVSFNGISIGSINISELFINYYLMDINIKKDILDLNLARNNVIRNEKYHSFEYEIEKRLCEEISKYFKKIDDKKNYLKNINEFFSNSVSSDDFNNIEELIKIFYHFRCITNDGLSFKKYNEINKYEYIINAEMTYLAEPYDCNYYSVFDKIFEHFSEYIDINEETVYLIEPSRDINKKLNKLFSKIENLNFELLLINDPKYNLISIESILGDFFDFADHHVFLASSQKHNKNNLFIWIGGDLNDADFFLNKEHKFIELIFNNSLSEDQKKLINGWLRNLNYNIDSNSFLKLQESIIKTFNKEQLAGDISNYLIRNEELKILELFLR